MASLTMHRLESDENLRKSVFELAAVVGRVLFGLMFIIASLGHFHGETVAYASAHGVPAAEILVPFSGAMELVGGASILLGFKARWGALLLIGFLIPDTFVMHDFWALNGAAADIQGAMFTKNLGLLAAAFLILYTGSGPHSLDNMQLKDYRRAHSH